MSYIERVGNLMATPELRTSESTGKPYCFARVAVNDRRRNENDEWVTTAMTAYNLTIGGDQAVNLVKTAETSGNVRVLFTGDYRVNEYQRKDGGTGISHDVRVNEIGIALRGQTVTVDRSTKATPEQDASIPEWERVADL